MKRALPDTWKRVPLKKCCKVVSGATPRRDVAQYWGGDIPWVTPKDLSRLSGIVLDRPSESITRQGYDSCSAAILPAGAVLFSSRAPIGLVAIAGREMATNQGFKSLVPTETINSHFLYWVMRWSAPVIDAKASGTTFKEVSKADVEAFEIPLPPLQEQRRIAAILDRVDAIRRKRQEAIALTYQLLRSTFLEMFGDPVTNPKRWSEALLGELSHADDRINYGIVQPGEDCATGIPIVRVGDFDKLRISTDSLKKVAPEIEAQYSRSRLVGDEILIACVGSIGKIALCSQELAGLNIVRAVTRVRLAPHFNHHREFFAFLLTLPAAQEYFGRETRTVSQPTLNVEQIKRTPVLVPDEASREHFCRFFRLSQAHTSRMHVSWVHADNLFNSLVQRAFSGQL